MDFGPVAYAALFALVPLTFLAFSRRRPTEAALTAIFVAILFGPMHVFVRIPPLPPMGKESVTYMTVLGILLARHRRFVREAVSDVRPFLLPVLAMFSCVMSGITNGDALTFGQEVVLHVPEMTLKDGLAFSLVSFLRCFLPFLVGRSIIRSPRDLHTLLRMLAGFGLVYAPLALLEVRLSPNLHLWVYGYRPHEDFSQTMRWGGYRPNLFMAHGLAVSLFFVAATLAMATLGEREKFRRFAASKLVFALAFVVVACKSTGSILYMLVFLPFARSAKPATLLRIALLVAVFVTAYPIIVANSWLPTEKILALAENFGTERAASLFTRLHDEALILAHARERVLFGWGSFGRHLIYSSWDARVTVITDGAWIILMSMEGALGLLGEMGTLVLPIYGAFRARDRIPESMRRDVAGLALILALVSLDLLPNGLFSNYPFLLAGGLSSAVGPMLERERARQRRERAARAALDELEEYEALAV